MATPYISAIILVVTLGISYYALAKDASLIERFLLYPYKMVRENNYLPLITHGLVHGSFLHMIVNMYVFYVFSFNLEKTIGNISFAIIYLGSLVISGAISTYKKKDRPDYRSLGASGAISGLLFSFILFYPQAQLLLFFVIPIDAWMFALLFLAGSYYAARNNLMPRIDHEAHFWGAIAGLVLTIVLVPGSHQPILNIFW